MSVINQMLKDLDERKTATPNGPHAPLMGQKNNSSKLPWVIVAILSIALIAWVLKDLLPVAPMTTDYEKVVATSHETEEQIVTKAEALTPETEQQLEPIIKATLAESERSVAEQTEATEVTLEGTEIPVTAEVADNTTEANKMILEPVADLVTNPVVTTNDEVVEKASQPRVVKVSPQLELRAKAQALYEQYQRESYGAISDAQYTEVLALDPDFHEVRISWLSRLSQQKDNRFEQESLMAIQRWPEIYQYRQMLARSWVAAEPQKAYDLLLQQTPTINQAPDYHGLIAYSAKQMGDFNLASKQYQLLLKSFPERADWWLALALAEDQLQRSASALRAYQQSLRFPGLAQNIQAYAEQRIKALQGY
ncbi:MAG: hypothetical protein KJO69_09085 [Gammaproteobacteria bacterium]|nr:hypothetical protein [Gammaproteobacteria bacterium]NNJ73271.1 hypothetical protein [Enterobacterales bacterium]